MPHVPPIVLRHTRYAKEHRYMQGRLPANSDQPSLLFYTTHKCASTLMRRLLAIANRRAIGLTQVNLAAYFWEAADVGTSPVVEQLRSRSRECFRPRGYLYAPLRHYVDTSHLPDAQYLLMLRDPRDVLVSAYFSSRFSHRAPANPLRRELHAARRKQLEDVSLEENIIARAPALASKYATYRENIPRSSLVTYEQMWWDFPGFAQRIAGIVGAEFDDALVADMAALAQVGGHREENQSAVRRKGTPGDHREKLSPALCARLEEQFSDTLRWMYD